MKRRQGLLATLAALLAGHAPFARAALPKPRMGELKSIGGDRYRLGAIVIDKRARSFTVPGRVHAVGKPLEYLATAPGGMKEYESLFELDTMGSEFNLACILVGMEADPKQVHWRHYRETPRLLGQRIALSVAWTDNGKRRQVPVAEALLNPDADVKPETVEWIYLGAPASEGTGRFAADDTGTLIGFIHDPNCIIDSVATIGIGAYGSVRGHAMLPPKGTPMELVVEAATPPK